MTAATAACAGALCPIGCTSPGGDGNSGEGGDDGLGTVAAGPVDAGPLGDYGRDGIFDRFAASHGFFLVRRAGRLYAATAVCTHQRARLVADGGSGFKCPRHGARFDGQGHVIKGPARRPLPRLAVRLDERGHVVVDPSARFGPEQWNQPAGFIVVGA